MKLYVVDRRKRIIIDQESIVAWEVSAALQAGVRHIDTASIYKNEAAVGAAVAGADVFVTSKCSPYEMRKATAWTAGQQEG